MLYVVDGIIVFGCLYMCYSSFFKKKNIQEYNSDNEVEQINSNYLTFDDCQEEMEALV
tara:strand:+ start:79 stop:252 length:174 start_codon:yes stop_codon:yes gene_type:complete